MSAGRAFITLGVLATVLLLGTAGRCETSEAEALFERARASMSSGNYESARTDLEESYRLDPANGTLLNLAVCEEKLGHFRAAYSHLAVARQNLSAEDRRIPSIDQRLRELEARIPTEASAPAPRAELAPPPAAAAEAPAAPVTRVSEHPLLPHAVAAGAVGLAGITVGIVGAAQVLHYKHAMAGHCDSTGCDPTGLAAASSGKAWSLAGTIGAVAGVVGLGSAAWLYFGVRPSASPSAQVMVRGTF